MLRNTDTFVAGLITCAISLLPRPVLAQAARPAPPTEEQFARHYAPMYWFAIDEPLYPTQPHPFAFDGIPLQTANSQCSLRKTDGPADFLNPTELTLDESCDRVALKRHFRPLLEGRLQGAPNAQFGPHPRMRILFDGPFYFSGGIDLTKDTALVCGGNEDVELMARLRDFRALPDAWKDTFGLKVERSLNRDSTGLCSGNFTVHRTEEREKADAITGIEQVELAKKGVKFKVRLAWEDTCRDLTVLERPADTCAGPQKLMAFAGVGDLQEQHGVVLKPRYLIQYWAYFPYDRGINGHRHDGEHTFVFLEGPYDTRLELAAPVVAIVGGGHEEDSANNILLAGSLTATAAVFDQIVFPETLPRHPMVLVELGKHASAPDRNLNGRFDMGVDANLWGENSWGSRDTQSALFGKAQIGKMEGWYSMPRSADGVFIEESAWIEGTEKNQPKPFDSQYRLGYPQAAFNEFSARVLKEIPNRDPRTGLPVEGKEKCDFGDDRTYRLMPISTLRILDDIIRNALKDSDQDRGWRTVQANLELNKNTFWEPDCQSGVPPANVDQSTRQNIMAALQGWVHTETEKRDVWRHRKFKDPDSVFKTHLFPQFTVGWGLRRYSGTLQHALVFQAADLLKTKHFHDSTLEIAVAGWKQQPDRTPFFKRTLPHVSVTFENFRGRQRGWYAGLSVDSDPDAKNRWNFRAGYGVQFATLETVPILGAPFKKVPGAWAAQRTKLAFRVGGRGFAWGGRALVGRVPRTSYQPFAFEWAMNLNVTVKPSKHPMKFFSDGGRDPKEEIRR